jgi:hypothetical protein
MQRTRDSQVKMASQMRDVYTLADQISTHTSHQMDTVVEYVQRTWAFFMRGGRLGGSTPVETDAPPQGNLSYQLQEQSSKQDILAEEFANWGRKGCRLTVRSVCR